MFGNLLDALCITVGPRIAGRTHAIRFTKFGDRGRIESSFPLHCAIRRALRHWSIWHNAIQPVFNQQRLSS